MIDLHCHSAVSDGALTPDALAGLAHENGCRLLALTDHDHTGGCAALQTAGAAHGMRVITGTEISVTWRNRTVHIVGLDIDTENEALQGLLAANRAGRPARLRQIAARLTALGLPDITGAALSLAQNPEMAGRLHAALALVELGVVKNKQQAFKKYLGDKAPANIAHRWAALPKAVSAIRAAGGIAVLAHPMRYPYSRTLKTALFEDFTDCGGHAAEVHCGRSFAKDRTDYRQVIKRYGLMASIGSDFHRLGDFAGGRLGAPLADTASVENPVWKDWL